jgi:hypothetical protein
LFSIVQDCSALFSIVQDCSALFSIVQQKMNLSYQDVMEEPLILMNIMSFLNPVDIVLLSLSSKEDRFQDIIFDRLEELKKSKKEELFENELELLVQSCKRNHNNIQIMNSIFDHLLTNKWFLDDPKYANLKNTVEDKLICFLITDVETYSHNALFYLEALFDILVQNYYDYELEEHVEYVVNRHGVKTLL